MRGIKVGWWTFVITLVVLMVPIGARADYGTGGLGGGPDLGGDPDQPGSGRMSPDTRVRGVGNGNDYRRTPSILNNQGWMRRYLTLLSGVRVYYLRF